MPDQKGFPDRYSIGRIVEMDSVRKGSLAFQNEGYATSVDFILKPTTTIGLSLSACPHHGSATVVPCLGYSINNTKIISSATLQHR